jgi:thiamine biosynthesis lipoprotein
MGVVASTGAFIIRRAEPVMGTVVSFDVRPQGIPAVRARAALREACHVLHRADATFSLYRPDSAMSQVRRGRLSLDDAPAEIAEVLGLCAQVRDMSDGWFDPWAMPGGIDPTGLVKGWAAGRAVSVLCAAGVGAAMINAAGDIGVFGEPGSQRPWRIGVRSSDAPDELCCVVEPTGAVATSGQYERGPHVVNPKTGKPADTVRSATVCGSDLAVADALATGLLAAGAAGLAMVAAAGYEAMIIGADKVLRHTDGFPIVG